MENAQSACLLARAIRGVLLERRRTPIDPDSYDPASDQFLSDPHAILGQLAAAPANPGDFGGETTHVSVMDAEGNTVGLTQSVQFGLRRQGGTTASSVAPLIVLLHGVPWLVVGSPGTERIISAVVQFLVM